MGVPQCRAMAVLAFGVMQILVGLTLMILGILTCVWYSWAKYDNYYAPGVWSGIIVMLCGTLGLAGGILKERGLMTAFMVVSIFEALFLSLPVLFLSREAWQLDLVWTTSDAFNSWPKTQQTKCTGNDTSVLSSLAFDLGFIFCANMPAANANLGIVVLAGLLGIVAIVSASVACYARRAVCR